MNNSDHRKAAEARINDLSGMLETQPKGDVRDALLRECAALAIAIAAFHMEGIRFRMFNVDRLMSKGGMDLPAEAASAFSAAREHLEAAGFHTRSHQAPGA
jgi:hypothetical protein